MRLTVSADDRRNCFVILNASDLKVLTSSLGRSFPNQGLGSLCSVFCVNEKYFLGSEPFESGVKAAAGTLRVSKYLLPGMNLKDGDQVDVVLADIKPLESTPKVQTSGGQTVSLVPASVDFYEEVERNSDFICENLLSQVRVVFEGQQLPIHCSRHLGPVICQVKICGKDGVATESSLREEIRLREEKGLPTPNRWKILSLHDEVSVEIPAIVASRGDFGKGKIGPESKTISCRVRHSYSLQGRESFARANHCDLLLSQTDALALGANTLLLRTSVTGEYIFRAAVDHEHGRRGIVCISPMVAEIFKIPAHVVVQLSSVPRPEALPVIPKSVYLYPTFSPSMEIGSQILEDAFWNLAKPNGLLIPQGGYIDLTGFLPSKDLTQGGTESCRSVMVNFGAAYDGTSHIGVLKPSRRQETSVSIKWCELSPESDSMKKMTVKEAVDPLDRYMEKVGSLLWFRTSNNLRPVKLVNCAGAKSATTGGRGFDSLRELTSSFVSISNADSGGSGGLDCPALFGVLVKESKNVTVDMPAISDVVGLSICQAAPEIPLLHVSCRSLLAWPVSEILAVIRGLYEFASDSSPCVILWSDPTALFHKPVAQSERTEMSEGLRLFSDLDQLRIVKQLTTLLSRSSTSCQSQVLNVAVLTQSTLDDLPDEVRGLMLGLVTLGPEDWAQCAQSGIGFSGTASSDAVRLELIQQSNDRQKTLLDQFARVSLGGLQKQLELLMEATVFQLKHPHLFTSKSGKWLCPRGALVVGPSGCGKTSLALKVAKESGLQYFFVRGPELLDKFIGATEAKLKDLFDRARSEAPSLIILDDLDALCPKRGSSQAGLTDRLVNQLLVYLDGVGSEEGVFTIAVTAHPELIDPAVCRPGRLDLKVVCNAPTRTVQARILEAIANDCGLASLNSIEGEADYLDTEVVDRYAEFVADHLSENCTGADIRGICAAAKVISAKRREQLAWSHVMQATRSVNPFLSIDAFLGERDFFDQFSGDGSASKLSQAKEGAGSMQTFHE